MPTAEKVRDLTLDTIETARGRAEDLVATSSQGLARAANRAVELAHEVELPSVEVPAVDEIVERAASHKLRTTLLVSLVVLLIVLVLRKVASSGDEPVPDTAS